MNSIDYAVILGGSYYIRFWCIFQGSAVSASTLYERSSNDLSFHRERKRKKLFISVIYFSLDCAVRKIKRERRNFGIEWNKLGRIVYADKVDWGMGGAHIYYRWGGGGGTNSPAVEELPKNSGRQRCNTKQIPYLGPPYEIQSPGRPCMPVNTQNKAEIFVNDAKFMYVTLNENHQQSRMLYNCM
jgi:hypothetical protein